MAFELDKDRLEGLDHLARDAGSAVLETSPGLGVRGELRADHEQLALEPQDEVAQSAEPGGERSDAPLCGEVRPRESECGDGLVDGAVRLGSLIVLRDARAAEQEAGRAVVALRRRDDRGYRAAGAHRRAGRITT